MTEMLQRKPFDVNEILPEQPSPITQKRVQDLAKAIGVNMETEELLEDRQSTHGDFRTNARLSQNLKHVFRTYEGWDHLDDVEKEVLDMISLKISRILSGRSLERRHWEDIAGYAHLALRECK